MSVADTFSTWVAGRLPPVAPADGPPPAKVRAGYRTHKSVGFLGDDQLTKAAE